jgi:hypothetical protein
MSNYGQKNPQQQEREAAQELVKQYGTAGATEGVLGEPHPDRYGRIHRDLWIIEKDQRGKLGEPIKKPLYGGGF